MAAIFASHEVKALPDLSLELLEDTDWQAGRLTTLDYHLQVTAFATDPTSGLFALGTLPLYFRAPVRTLRAATSKAPPQATFISTALQV